MAVTYGLICKQLLMSEARISRSRSTHRPHTSMTTERRRNVSIKGMSRNKQVTFMCITLVASFIILWLPFHAVHLAKIDGIAYPLDEVSTSSLQLKCTETKTSRSTFF